ncbi:hypothetical protein N7G274_009414 [Stereocaulon virgatum]|uniref:RING-type domain-containing protein n=1 Tax=Stereocaulon virgatum TaxID=373712 RepID=A0ABR3ZZH7_9LECA
MPHPARLPRLLMLKKLIEAFDQFLEEHDYVLEGSPGEIYKYVTNALGLSDEISIPVPTPLAFIVRLPKVDPSELPEDRRDCGICLQPLHSAHESKYSPEDLKLEVAVKLPCGHDCLGIRCLWEWFTPFGGLNNNTCPMCRAVCFDKFPEQDTIEGLQACVDVFEYGLQNGFIQRPDVPHPPWRETAKAVKTEILVHWLNEANIEVDSTFEKTAREIAEQTGAEILTYRDHGRFDDSTPRNLKDLALCKSLLRVVEVHLYALRGR